MQQSLTFTRTDPRADFGYAAIDGYYFRYSRVRERWHVAVWHLFDLNAPTLNAEFDCKMAATTHLNDFARLLGLIRPNGEAEVKGQEDFEALGFTYGLVPQHSSGFWIASSFGPAPSPFARSLPCTYAKFLDKERAEQFLNKFISRLGFPHDRHCPSRADEVKPNDESWIAPSVGIA